MQAKNHASINASFDPSKGGLLAKVYGDNFGLCYLLGVLINQIAISHARVTGCTESEALDKTLKIVAEKAPGKGTVIDLSREMEVRADD